MLAESYGSSGNSYGSWEGSSKERKKGIFKKWRLAERVRSFQEEMYFIVRSIVFNCEKCGETWLWKGNSGRTLCDKLIRWGPCEPCGVQQGQVQGPAHGSTQSQAQAGPRME